MAKITFSDKVGITDNQLPEVNKWTDDNINETKQSVNDLYDIVGAGTTSDNKIVFSKNTTGDLADLLDSITDASTSNRYFIEARPGVYTTKPVTWKPYVYMKGNDKGSVIFSATTVTDTIFTMATSSSISDITIQGATSGVGLTFNDAGFCFLKDITIVNCDKGVVLNNSGGNIDVENITGSTTVAQSSIVSVLAGNATLTKVTVAGSSTYSKAVEASGANVVTTISLSTSFSANVDYGIYIDSGARVNIIGSNFVAGKTALYITGNGTKCFAKSSVATLVQEYGIHIPNDSTTPELITEGIIISNSTIYDALLENSSATIAGDISLNLAKTSLVHGGDVNLTVKNQFPGDKGVVQIGETHTGTPSYPSESVFGEGDSHTVQKVYTETDLNVFADKTIEASSVTGSTYTYTGTGVGNSIYVANLYPNPSGNAAPFYGVKVKIETAAVLGTGSIIAEYWNGAWTEFNCSTQLSGGSYWKYAKEYFNRTGDYHIKFDPDIVADWAANDPVSLGTNYYWVRFRISSAITTAPVLQQNKISPSRSEKNPDGTDEYHGLGRTIKKVTLDAAGPIEGNMQNTDIYVDQNIGVSFTANRYTAIADIRGYSFELPEDCDTSGKLILVWKGKHAATGNSQFTVRLKIVKPGDSYTNTEPGASAEAITILTPLTAVTADTRQDYRVDIDISEAIPARENGFGDEIWLSIQNTTRSGNFDIVKVSANYLSDFNGRHL